MLLVLQRARTSRVLMLGMSVNFLMAAWCSVMLDRRSPAALGSGLSGAGGGGVRGTGGGAMRGVGAGAGLIGV